MKKTLPAEYEVTIIPEEDDYFAARLPDFPGIITGGRTPEEALSNAAKIEAFAKTQRAQGFPYIYGLAAIKFWTLLEGLVDEIVSDRLREFPAVSVPALARAKGPLVRSLAPPATGGDPLH